MEESKTAWPSYYIQKFITDNVGGLEAVTSIKAISESEVRLSISDEKIRGGVLDLLGESIRGVKITYILDKNTPITEK